MSLSQALRDAFSAAAVEVAMLVEVELASPVRLWTGPDRVAWDSKAWTPGMLDISGLSADAVLGIDRATIVLQGVDPAIAPLADLVTTDVQGRVVTVWIAAVGAGPAIVDADVIFRGRVDTLRIVDAGTSLMIHLGVENELTVLDRIRGGTYTAADQRDRFAGDSGLDFVTTTRQEISWGRPD